MEEFNFFKNERIREGIDEGRDVDRF